MSDPKSDFRDLLTIASPPEEIPSLLLAEFHEAIDFFNESDTQFRRRSAYRSAFAFVEGMLHYLKLSTYSHYYRIVKPVVLYWEDNFDLKFPEEGFFKLIDEDLLLTLLDKQFQISENGKWKLKESWLTTTTNFRFAVRIVSEIYGIPEEDISGEGWESFKRCVQTRNRVTHPKALEEFDVSDDEMKSLESAMTWFQEKTTALLREVVGAIDWDQVRVDRLFEACPELKSPEYQERLKEMMNIKEH
jgi:hypothetical protein